MSDASWMYTCSWCHVRVSLDRSDCLDCVNCGAVGALVADEDAGGTPSEGHAGLPNRGVSLESQRNPDGLKASIPLRGGFPHRLRTTG